jgi:hypothetical protein
MDLKDWLRDEIALVEAQLTGAGPTCQLDRQGASPPSLKETEGRYFVLRRASRLLELGQPLTALAAEADKARAFLAADQGLARNRVWAAYFKGVLDAVQALQQQADGTRISAGQESSGVDAGQSPRRAT